MKQRNNNDENSHRKIIGKHVNTLNDKQTKKQQKLAQVMFNADKVPVVTREEEEKNSSHTTHFRSGRVNFANSNPRLVNLLLFMLTLQAVSGNNLRNNANTIKTTDLTDYNGKLPENNPKSISVVPKDQTYNKKNNVGNKVLGKEGRILKNLAHKERGTNKKEKPHIQDINNYVNTGKTEFGEEFLDNPLGWSRYLLAYPGPEEMDRSLFSSILTNQLSVMDEQLADSWFGIGQLQQDVDVVKSSVTALNELVNDEISKLKQEVGKNTVSVTEISNILNNLQISNGTIINSADFVKVEKKDISLFSTVAGYEIRPSETAINQAKNVINALKKQAVTNNEKQFVTNLEDIVIKGENLIVGIKRAKRKIEDEEKKVSTSSQAYKTLQEAKAELSNIEQQVEPQIEKETIEKEGHESQVRNAVGGAALIFSITTIAFAIYIIWLHKKLNKQKEEVDRRLGNNNIIIRNLQDQNMQLDESMEKLREDAGLTINQLEDSLLALVGNLMLTLTDEYGNARYSREAVERMLNPYRRSTVEEEKHPGFDLKSPDATGMRRRTPQSSRRLPSSISAPFLPSSTSSSISLPPAPTYHRGLDAPPQFLHVYTGPQFLPSTASEQSEQIVSSSSQFVNVSTASSQSSASLPQATPKPTVTKKRSGFLGWFSRKEKQPRKPVLKMEETEFGFSTFVAPSGEEEKGQKTGTKSDITSASASTLKMFTMPVLTTSASTTHVSTHSTRLGISSTGPSITPAHRRSKSVGDHKSPVKHPESPQPPSTQVPPPPFPPLKSVEGTNLEAFTFLPEGEEKNKDKKQKESMKAVSEQLHAQIEYEKVKNAERKKVINLIESVKEKFEVGKIKTRKKQLQKERKSGAPIKKLIDRTKRLDYKYLKNVYDKYTTFVVERPDLSGDESYDKLDKIIKAEEDDQNRWASWPTGSDFSDMPPLEFTQQTRLTSVSVPLPSSSLPPPLPPRPDLSKAFLSPVLSTGLQFASKAERQKMADNAMIEQLQGRVDREETDIAENSLLHAKIEGLKATIGALGEEGRMVVDQVWKDSSKQKVGDAVASIQNAVKQAAASRDRGPSALSQRGVMYFPDEPYSSALPSVFAFSSATLVSPSPFNVPFSPFPPRDTTGLLSSGPIVYSVPPQTGQESSFMPVLTHVDTKALEKEREKQKQKHHKTYYGVKTLDPVKDKVKALEKTEKKNDDIAKFNKKVEEMSQKFGLSETEQALSSEQLQAQQTFEEKEDNNKDKELEQRLATLQQVDVPNPERQQTQGTTETVSVQETQESNQQIEQQQHEQASLQTQPPSVETDVGTEQQRVDVPTGVVEEEQEQKLQK